MAPKQAAKKKSWTTPSQPPQWDQYTPELQYSPAAGNPLNIENLGDGTPKALFQSSFQVKSTEA